MNPHPRLNAIYFTVTVQLALQPLFILSVIFAFPFFNAFIFPVFLFTVTFFFFEDVQLDILSPFVCFLIFNLYVLPFLRVNLFFDSLTLDLSFLIVR